MNINLELYKIFYVVAKNSHMTKASEELNVSQPAISQSIKKLEEQIGSSLFLRSNKGMQLTKEGKMLYGNVSNALEIINKAEIEFTSFKNMSKGKINIGASTTLTKLFLINVIENFHNKYPGIDINIVNGLTSDLVLELQMGKLDLIIFNDSTCLDVNIKIKSIGKLKQGFIYNPKYFSDNINHINDLNKFPLILQDKKSNSRKFLDKYTLENNIVLIPKIEIVSQELITEFTNIGLGIGFAIIDLAKRNYPTLKELKINRGIPQIDVCLAINNNENLTFACKEFIKYFD